MQNDTKELRKGMFYTFLICLGAAMASFVPFIIQDGGYFALCDDFNNQMVPFAAALNNHLKSGGGSWVWNTGLGAQTLGAYSYYYLGSIFFWISFLFKGSFFPYLVGPFYILKYALTGMFAYLYLQRYSKKQVFTIMLSMLYAFSGFQSINLEFYVFHDIVMLFPLLLYALDMFYTEGKKNILILAVFLNCILNYFFFYGEVVFLIVYTLFMYYDRDTRKEFWKKTRTCILLGLTGVFCAGAIFVPSAVYIFGNPRSLPDIVKMWHTPVDIPNVIKGFLYPAEPMNDQSIVLAKNWRSMSIYIPLFGATYVFAYVVSQIKSRKPDRLTYMLLFFTAISFIPVIESTFYIFTAVYYRWWYMFLLVALIAMSKVLYDPDSYPIKGSIVFTLICTITFFLFYFIGNMRGIEKYTILRRMPFLAISAVAIGSLVYLLFIHLIRKNTYRILFISAAAFCVMTTFYAIHMYRKTSDEKDYIAYFNSGASLQTINAQYRYRSIDNILMYPGGANGTGTFNSTISNSVRDFEDLFDYSAKICNMPPEDVDGLNEFLAAKYEIIKGDKDVHTYEIVEHDACPIGYRLNNFIYEDEFMSFDVADRGVIILDTLVYNKKNADKAGSLVTHADVSSIDTDHGSIGEKTAVNVSNAVSDFKRIKNGFECTSGFDEDSMVLFTVPYDYGWRAYVDGVKSTVIRVDGGFMTIAVPAGQHDIVFKYRSPGLVIGAIMSVIGFAYWIGINAVASRAKRS